QSDVKLVRVSPGLSVLRYVSARDTITPPSVHLGPATAAGRLDLIPAPGEAPDVLRSPGGAVVLVADAEIELTITVVRHPASNSAAVELHLEPLAPAASSDAREEHWERERIETPSPASRVSVLGHVARRGDVIVASGEWLGGPEFPARI